MGMLKNYLLTVVCRCSENQFGQDAIEHAVAFNLVKLTGNLEIDVKTIMGQYDAICDAYRTKSGSGLLWLFIFTNCCKALMFNRI